MLKVIGSVLIVYYVGNVSVCTIVFVAVRKIEILHFFWMSITIDLCCGSPMRFSLLAQLAHDLCSIRLWTSDAIPVKSKGSASTETTPQRRRKG